MIDPMEKLIAELELQKPSGELDKRIFASLRQIGCGGEEDPQELESYSEISSTLTELQSSLKKPSGDLDKRIFASLKDFHNETFDARVSDELDKRVLATLKAVEEELSGNPDSQPAQQRERNFPKWAWFGPIAACAACMVFLLSPTSSEQIPNTNPEIAVIEDSQPEQTPLYVLEEVPTDEYIKPDETRPAEAGQNHRRWVDNRNGVVIDHLVIPVKSETFE